MSKIAGLMMLTLALVVAPFLAGCVITSDKAVFKSSSKFDIPNISGAFRANKGGAQEVYVLKRVDGTTNTFTLTAPDKNVMTLIFEPLKAKSRYLVQISNSTSPEVIFSLCSMQDLGKVDIYGLKPAKLPALAKKYGLTLDNTGRITKQSTSQKLKNFFETCFNDPQYSGKLDTITIGSSKEK